MCFFFFFSSLISINLLINMGRTKVLKAATTEIKVLCLTVFFFVCFHLGETKKKKRPHLKELFRFRYQQRSSGGKTVKHAICSHITNIQKSTEAQVANLSKMLVFAIWELHSQPNYSSCIAALSPVSDGPLTSSSLDGAEKSPSLMMSAITPAVAQTGEVASTLFFFQRGQSHFHDHE